MFQGAGLSHDLMLVLMIVWIIFACFCLTRYFFAIQNGRHFIKTQRKKLVGDLALSLLVLGVCVAIIKLIMELLGY